MQNQEKEPTAEKSTDKKKRHKKRKLTRFFCILGIILLVLIVLAVVAVIVFNIYAAIGKKSLQQHAAQSSEALQMTSRPDEEQDKDEIAKYELEEGQILYHGEIYEYNEDILTFLCMGIDNRQGIDTEKTPGAGGQADMIMLLVLDSEGKQLQMINVSRDSMVPVSIYDEYGFYVEDKTMQLALQYAYGDGREKSCELMEKAVSRLFYGIPIHGYAALGLDTIADLNDAIGGVTLTIADDVTWFTSELIPGETMTLTGDQALGYVQSRDTNAEELGSNNLRMSRQKQYMMAFVNQAKQKMKQDLTVPVTLYQTAEKQMVTSVSIDEVAYLSTAALDCSFTEANMYSIEGTYQRPDQYEEYIVDDDALYELILQVFYRKVEQ